MSQEKKAIEPSVSEITAPKKKGLTRKSDTSLGWVGREYPQLAPWQRLAVKWLKGEVRGMAPRLTAMAIFLERYIIRQRLPLDPAAFLSRDTILPDFYRTVCPDSVEGINYNNTIHAFLNFVLLLDFSETSDYGQLVVSPAFYNPVPRLSRCAIPKRDESVHSPLPYGYIDELRQVLAAGPHFKDWHWAQSAIGSGIGKSGICAPDWFEVTEDQIDKNDPDCIWRVRPIRTDTRLEIWSPVRWVALLVKLILPLRTFQVRMLDSGEADTWRFSAEGWALNSSPLAQGSERRPLQQGVFRKSNPLADGEAVSTILYISTNKTTDTLKFGPDKGYNLPWLVGGPVHQDVFYWLEKLRNWQEKYNPISRRTPWAELDGRHLKVKTDVQLASYADACFLFRMPETAEGEHHLPLKEMTLAPSWYRLLETLQQRLAARGETHRNGTPILFIPPVEPGVYALKTLFPLHSLRVSLITALALDGKVPFPILQKLVGHSRLLMTVYYTKPGATHIRDVLLGAADRLEANKEASIQTFLLDTEHGELLQNIICNSVSSVAAAIPEHPAARTPTGWMPMHHGLCLVGGNTSALEENSAVDGCHNGGVNIGSPSVPKFTPVPGGIRNCIRCRWFVTEPHHLPALTAHFNTLAYHFDEARNTCLASENELQHLKKQKIDAEEIGHPFTRMNDYRQAERVWEKSMKRFSDLAEDLVSCWRLIERCKAALETSHDECTQLIAVGTVADVHVTFEETESELLQLAGVCEDVEVYPDLEPGKAVFRRSQLLDAVLYRDDMAPVFMLLSEDEQLKVGNAFLRHLARQMNPKNPALGKREVIHLIDAGVSLSQHFNLDLTSLLPTANFTRHSRGEALLQER
ncbi:putative integrase [Pseudomonas cannabina pv. alisalensis]|uniref:Integrase n=2 Tax=Pseudomonas cannabina TaxID=86840 RepID=A0A3M3QGI9_PSECA|nr:integrase family protein [Pseudomonas cannabina]KPW16398.1 putative integrase [Pseudomonas cannabina pv. alisalensis]MBM0137536.1 integrase [Pseudomonas cannabina pv. alisalensis]RMN78876.1 hypothetical protein ALQ52_200145 [Pseudomonas cannabina pv. alisalensis]RMN83336.1 putative integrase [Pseudomonas cannabina]RMN91458.1 putative integrase [Pseudomonas cannabina]